MKSIDIRTAQNVAITYELASAQDRFLSFFLDVIIKFFGLACLNIIFEILFDGSDNILATVITLACFIFWIFLFNLFCEYKLQGRTLGKRIIGIKVIKLNGQPAGIYDYLLRWSFRLIDGYSNLGIVGLMSIASTSNAQRLGDLVSNTICVKVKAKAQVSLDDILKIHTTDNYTPVYPAAKSLQEEDIVLAKQVIDRRRNHPNEAHENAEYALAERLSVVLGLASVPNNYSDFIRTVIKDYVVLTR